MKIILIIVVILFGLILINVIGQATGHKYGGGPIGTIITLGLFAAVMAIWKYQPKKEQDQDTSADKKTLDKR